MFPPLAQALLAAAPIDKSDIFLNCRTGCVRVPGDFVSDAYSGKIRLNKHRPIEQKDINRPIEQKDIKGGLANESVGKPG
jgi:hypothetical protein